MTEEGERILGRIRQTLLRTAEKAMERKGWVPESNNAVTGASGMISLPKAWLPSTDFRFFTNNAFPSLLAFISVLLDDENSGEYTIPEPMVTAGLLDFGQGRKASETEWDYWYSEWYGYSSWYGAKRERNDWPIIQMGPTDDWKTKWKGAGANEVTFQSFKCFGMPLITVTNDEDVQSKIVTPLLALV